MSKRFKNILKFILLLYFVTGLLFYFFQERILFHPISLAADYNYDFKLPHRDIYIKDSTSNINIIQFETDSIVKGVVLYFHGNKKNISWYAKYPPMFTKHGYEVWMIDYPGFGKSTGNFSEEALYKNAEILYDHALKNFPQEKIIIYGKSMGSGIAAYLASKHKAKQLILETPYYSFTSLVQHYLPVYPINWMLKYKIPTNEYLFKTKIPTYIFHGTADGVIPYSNAEKLKAILKDGDEFVTIQIGGHNDLHSFKDFNTKLDSILKIQ